MSRDLKCKDYFIFKFRYYANKRILDRHGPSHKQHWERAEQSHRFFWIFFEKATKVTEDLFREKFVFGSEECALEELIEKCGIYRFNIGEGFQTYVVPWKHIELINWLKSTLKKPHRIVTRASFGYVNVKAASTYQREKSLEMTKDFKHKCFIAESTRKILIEKKIPYKF